jgi:hypothetical protein
MSAHQVVLQGLAHGGRDAAVLGFTAQVQAGASFRRDAEAQHWERTPGPESDGRLRPARCETSERAPSMKTRQPR